MSDAGSEGSGVPKVPESRAMPGYSLLSPELIVKVCTAPRGTSARMRISGAVSCVAPMTKLPSVSVDGTAPSGSSVAWTYPGVRGSRVGGVGRAGGVVGRAPALVVAGAAGAIVVVREADGAAQAARTSTSMVLTGTREAGMQRIGRVRGRTAGAVAGVCVAATVAASG